MKKFIRIFGVMFLAVFVLTSLNPGDCLARKKQKYRKELTDDPNLEEANESYKKAVRFIKRGDGAFHKRPGEAKQSYSTAESYLNSAIFELKKLGHKNDIDVSKEIMFCENLQSNTHVKAGKLKKYMRN